MCWIGKETDIRVSKEDIKVFKVVYGIAGTKKCFVAPFQSFEYRLNTEYTSEIEVRKRIGTKFTTPYNDICIFKALHCYSSDVCTFYKRIIDGTCAVVKHNQEKIVGYFSIKTPLCLDNKGARSTVIVEGIIPANTEYWINDDGEIATSKLILTKVKKNFQ